MSIPKGYVGTEYLQLLESKMVDFKLKSYARDVQSPRTKVQLHQTAVVIGNLGLPFEIYLDQEEFISLTPGR